MNAISRLKSVSSLALLVCMGPVLIACNSSDRSDITFEDFRQTVSAAAGPDAEGCGELVVGDSEVDLDSCLARAYTNDADAWGIVQRQGTDSLVASGTAVLQGAVTFYGFDSDPSGAGAENNGRISVTECVGPSLTGVVGQQEQGTQTFACETLVLVSQQSGGRDSEDQPVQVAGTPRFVGPTWVWTGYRPVIDGELEAVPTDTLDYTLEFTRDIEQAFSEEGEVGGKVLCNGFRGGWNRGELSNASALMFTDLIATEISCDDDQFRPETATTADYLQLLGSASSYSMQGDRLFIALNNGGTLYFLAVP